MRSRLKELRSRAGLTQVELADRAGLTQSTVSKIELGRGDDDAATLRALAQALGVRPSRQRALCVLRILHELAHHLLGRSRAHTHADVWRLTLALAWPVRRLRRGLPALEVPMWASELRLLILAESRMIPAA